MLFRKHMKTPNRDFKTLAKEGLLVKDFVPIRLKNEKRDRPGILVECKSEAFAYVILQRKNPYPLPVLLIGSYITGNQGLVLKKWAKLEDNRYEGLEAPVILVDGLRPKKEDLNNAS